PGMAMAQRRCSTIRISYLESKIGHATKSYDESIKDLHQQLDNEKNISKQKFEGFIDAYKNQMKLKATVQYWTDNVEHHKKSAKKFGIASIVLSLIIFLPIAYVAWEILAKEQVVWGKVGGCCIYNIFSHLVNTYFSSHVSKS
ncbi:DUF6161 domain-containing protein, partial [Aeromonas salmonicida]